ncbi:hypothetical protein PHYBOEH_008475 [Phytophthora boehmeriae]|uniref:Uncharacterized protein n=1 Tax=Phytophthora boehmeriae TaxID=109152 RepID=A0A8T1X9A5_9STRA|nr:hypothetical protein PHYBOEH_008475 [Phytophthora boehmeriae]
MDRRPMSARGLLATRVLPMEAFHQEMRDPRRQQEAEREIPVPLWPRETLQQYERDFVRWLTTEHATVEAFSFRLQGGEQEERSDIIVTTLCTTTSPFSFSIATSIQTNGKL